MATPSMEERIMELMPEDAKAALLLLARQLPCEVTQAWIASRAGGPDTLRSPAGKRRARPGGGEPGRSATSGRRSAW
jgi:hypothetical protein